MGRMDGKVALITGAGRGQGRSHAVTLAREGADILALDCPTLTGLPYELSTKEDLDQTVALVEQLDRRIIAAEGDVRNQADLDELVSRGIEEFGHIDVLVANAGIVTLNDFWDITDEEWNVVIDVCLKGSWRSAKAVLPHMIEREQGSIIFISSCAGLEAVPTLSHYVAAKHGVLGLMKSVAIEAGPRYGIRSNAVLPGAIDTDINKWQGMLDMMAGGEGLGTLEVLESGSQVWGALKEKGLLAPQSTSNAVLFLASDESADISGLELVVDAGHMALPGLNSYAMNVNQESDGVSAVPGA